MKDNKLDKAFKDGLQGGKMPYSESFWADMDALIPAAAPAAKTATAFGVRLAAWFMAIALIGVAGYFWFSGTGAEVELPTQPEPAQAVEADVTQPAAINAPDINSPQNEIEQTPQITAVENSSTALPETKTNTTEIATKAVATLNENPGQVSTTNAGSKTETPVQPTQNEVVVEDVIASANQPSKAPNTEVVVSAPVIANANKNETSVSGGTNSTNENLPAKQQNNTAGAEISADEETQMAGEDEIGAPKTPAIAPAPSAESAPEVAATPIILPHQKGKKLLWSAGVDYQYLLLNRSLTTTNSSLIDYVAFRTSYENPTYQSSVGANVQLEVNKWLFHSGIYSTVYHEEINYPSTLLVDVGVDNGQWQTNQIWNYTFDSTWVIDGIYMGHWQHDTVWNLTLDSLWQPQWDTVATEKEAPELAPNNGVFALSYLEIPLWFGRSFGNGNLHFDVQAGLGFGILTGSKGSVYINQNVDGLVTPAYQIEQFSQLNMSGMFRAGIRYEFTEQLQAVVYPMLRYTFTSVFKDAAIRQRYLGCGINVGVLYRF